MTKTTILLIDDDDDFLRALTLRCESIGLEVERARNFLTATFKTAKRVPDIICTDVHTPTGNGLSFCDALAADRHTSQVPLIVLTGKADSDTRQACKRLRVHYVEKTVNYWSTLEPILRRLAASTLGESRDPGSDIAPQGLPTELVRHESPAEIPEQSGQRKPKHILVADDDEDMVRLLTLRFKLLGCSVTGVNNGFDAINEINRLTPDLVCLDVSIPSGDGLSVSEMMASNERLRNIPIIILTGRSDEATIRRCHAMSAYYVEKSANSWERVEPLVRELLNLDREDLVDAVFAVLGASPIETCDGTNSDDISSLSADHEDVPWVLCIDDDADFTDAIKIRLENHGVAVIVAYSGMEGYRLAFTSPASAILLDFNMPNGQGDYILGRLKDNPVTKDIPVVVITGMKDKMLERRMLAMGATAFFVKPVSFDQLREHLSKYIDILGLTEGSLAADKHGKKFRRIVHHMSETD